MSYLEVRELPISYRHWFLNRLVRDIEKKNEKSDDNAKTSENMRSFKQYEEMLANKFK